MADSISVTGTDSVECDVRAGTCRQPWVRPELTVFDASDAEAASNPILPEGAFGTGS